MATSAESLICLWLAPDINSVDNKKTQKELRQIYNDLRTFTDVARCETEITNLADEKIVLIISGGFGRDLLPRLSDLPQLSVCYIYCGNKQAHEEWATQYPKIKGVLDRPMSLIKQISKDEANRMKAEDGASISVISSETDLQARNAIFLWLQLFIEVILHMHHKPTDRQEMIDICRKTYSNQSQYMATINEFETDYVSEKAIWWYTRDACFYRMLNKALRDQDYDILFSFRLFITDIAKLIQREYEKFIRENGSRQAITVYRGQLIGNDELDLIKKSVGQFLSMNSFLSTTRQRINAVDFARMPKKRDQTKRMLFQIKIDPKERTKTFADVNSLSFYKDEDEILIMLGALFKIEKVYYNDGDRLWIAEVSLASEDDFHLKGIFSHMKGKIGDDTNLNTLGKLLLRMDENEKARICYKRMLNETQLAVSDARLGLGWACLRCDACDEGIEHFKECLRIRQMISGEDHASVAEVYGFFGEAYRKKHDYKQAIVYLEKARLIQENIFSENSLELAAVYDTFGNIYTSDKNYALALEFFTKALKIREAELPEDHPQIAAVCNNMAWMFASEEKYDKALDYYTRALTISKLTLPPTHPHVVTAEDGIRRLKYKTKS